MSGNLRSQLDVIGALILRDVKTRFGRSELGYLFALAMPVGHVMILAFVWMVLKRPVPIGTSQLMFSATGILPFVVWTYPQRQIAVAILANKPLLYFPKVKIVDIMLARVLLEAITAFVGVTVVLFLLATLGEQVSPKDPFMFIVAMLTSLYFGVAVGMINGLIVACWSGWILPSMILSPILWASCGAVFMIDTIPAPYQGWLALNPLVHAVELARQSFYWDYRSSVLDIAYPFMVSTVLITLVLGAERLVRGRLLQA